MKYNFDKYLKKELSQKEKEELRHQFIIDQQFGKGFLSRCLVLKCMIEIEKNRRIQIISSVMTKD